MFISKIVNKNWLLQKKLNIILVLAFILTSIFLSIIYIGFQNRRIKTHTGKIYLLLETLVERDKKALANEIFENRIRAIELRIRQMIKVEGILSITVFDLNRQILHYDRNKNIETSIDSIISEKTISKIIERGYITNEVVDNKNTIAYYQVISAFGESLGYIKVNYSLSDIEFERNISYLLLSFQLLIIFTILFTLVKRFISNSIIKPLEYLQNRISEMSFEKLPTVIPASNNDEIGLLTTTFNKMSYDLIRAQNYIANIINFMPSILIGVDQNCFITQWNKTAEKETGVKSIDAIGKNIFNVYPHINDQIKNLKKSINAKKIITRVKKPISTDDGYKYINTTLYPISTENEEGGVIIIDDVTKQYNLEQQLTQTQKMEAIGQLAGGVAHDFNNMLGGIISAAQLLKTRKDKIEESEIEFIDLILQAATQASNLTSKLLAFGRKVQIPTSYIDLHTIIKDTIAILSRTIDKKIDIEVELGALNSVIIGDSSSIQNVILNLSINSSHSMPNGGKLKITTSNQYLSEEYCNNSIFEIVSGDYIKINVEDSGFGIPEKNLKRIFEPFYTTKELGKGSGLGLSAVYGTVIDHKGAIVVYSEVNQGTSIHIYFPCTKNSDEVNTKEYQIEKGTGLLLLVDDEEIIRITGKTLLEDMGYTVILAENGLEAVEVFKSRYNEIDVVIMDMIMPQMNGKEAFIKMKAIDNNCKVIITSGFTQDKSIEELNKLGLSGFIHKPYRDYEISSMLSKLLNN